MTRSHSPTCEADGAHDGDCATATELARLRAFAEAVRDEVQCPVKVADGQGEDYPDSCGDLENCFHCAALQALERAR